MPEEFKTPSQNSAFTTKPVEQPMFTSDLKSQITQTREGSSGSGASGFYRANKLYVWAFCVGVFIIAILSFFAFRKAPAPQVKEANVSIAVDAPSTVASGGDEVYRIAITNKDAQKLVHMQLELAYPDGVSYENSSPPATNLSGTVFPVPDLVSGLNTVVTVKARVSGNVNDTKDLTVRLRYQYNNISSQFVKEQHFSVRLIASNISLDLTGPSNANNGQLVAYSLHYQNNSDTDANNARISVVFPSGFTFASSDPAPSLGNNTWDIGTLAKGGSGTIQIQGAYNSVGPGESLTTTANFLILGNDGNYFTQNSATLTTAIANQPLLVTQKVNAPSSNIINPGDNLNFTLNYQNNASVAANAVNVVVTLDSNALDLSTVQAQGGQVNNNTITWNAASASQLQVLAPNEGGSLQFSVRVKNPATKDSSTKLTVVSHIKIKSNEYSTFFPGSDLSLKVSSPSSITGNLSFVNGSLPPKVGTNTTYKIRLTLRNATNDFSNTIVTAFIPLGAGGFSQSSVTSSEQKNVTFDPSTGKLTWNAGALAAHTGQFTQSRILEFNVNLNPSSNQANQSPLLVKDIALDANDTFTSQAVHDTTDNITTNDIQGNGYGNGQVVQ
jgi:uncharacterized repeat protein (TIGR01451 family)